MTRQEAQALIQRYIAGTCTAEEKVLIERWCNERFDTSDRMPPVDLDAVGKLIAKRLPTHKKKRANRYRLIAAAITSMAISLGIALYLNSEKVAIQRQQAVHDIAPGGDHAYLTLHTGEIIQLTDTENDTISTQAGISISKTADGELVYTATEDSAELSGPLAYNSISTPKGGQFQVQLPDGTKVWLNAASSITYPTSFSSSTERKITLHGEAYFEVAHDAAKPFIVHTAPHKNKPAQEVHVLGTRFNINSYENEDLVETTLVEGAVRVEADGNQVLLKPNQRARLKHTGLAVTAANTEETLAWKNGYFMFDDERIESIMRKIARWYDVEVVFQQTNNKQKFSGTVSKFTNVSSVLNILELTGGVRFEIEERRIIVK